MITFYRYSHSDFVFLNRSQIKQTLKKKAFEEAGIPVKQISMVQVQSPPPTLITPAAVIPSPAQISQIDDATVYMKTEPQIIASIPSTSTAQLIPTSSEPPNELLVSEVKEEDEIQIGTNDELNLLTNTDETLLTSLNVPLSQPLSPPPSIQEADNSMDSNEIKMDEEVTAE